VDSCKETCNLGVLDGGEVLVIETTESPLSVRMSSKIGNRRYVHSTALGKVLLAGLTHAEILRTVRSKGMPKFTAATITSENKVLIEVEKVRQQGFAIDNRENEVHGRCIAAPIMSRDRKVLAALSISGPLPSDDGKARQIAAERALPHLPADFGNDRYPFLTSNGKRLDEAATNLDGSPPCGILYAMTRSVRLTACAALLLFSQTARSGNKTLMHCFAWTPVKEATPADWDAFYKASDALPKRIKGILRVWYGKLDSPLSQTKLGKIDSPTFQKYRDGETVAVPVSRITRDYGMCMEMSDAEVLKKYDADPYHKVWTDAYSKVRVEGTTTFNILGQ
jgi:hypothetical protein